MNRILIVLIPLFLSGSVYAAPPVLEPIGVVVTNDNAMPVPVEIQSLPLVPLPVEIQSAPLVTCIWDAGTGSSSSSPFIGLGGSGSLLLDVQCPAGVDKIHVKRIGFSNIVTEFGTIVKFQMVVGYANQNSPNSTDPAGILAVLTDGAPIADVVQDFDLDRNDTSRTLYFRFAGSTGNADQPASTFNTVIFSGTPVQ